MLFNKVLKAGSLIEQTFKQNMDVKQKLFEQREKHFENEIWEKKDEVN